MTGKKPCLFFVQNRGCLLYTSEIAFESALKNHEFIVFYQPKVDIDTEKVVGAEAVSYTHLDVYKRQHCRMSAEAV